MFNRASHDLALPARLVRTGLAFACLALSAGVSAQMRELLVTEVRGNAVRASGKAAPLRTLDTVAAGERVRLSSDTRVGFFHAPDAQLYVVDGPAEVVIRGKQLLVNGKPAGARKLQEAYRNIRLDGYSPGSLTMRSGGSHVRIIGPEGVVPRAGASRFAWDGGEGPWYFEIAGEDGGLVHRERCSANEYSLPPQVLLDEGKRYAWGVSRRAGDLSDGDWTEFVIATAGASPPIVPGSAASDSERLLHAAWLRSLGLGRAALRSGNAAPR